MTSWSECASRGRGGIRSPPRKRGGVRTQRPDPPGGRAPAERILAVADEEQADVVIVGTHGRAGLQRAILEASRTARPSGPMPRSSRSSPHSGTSRGEDPADLLCDRLLADRPAAWPWVVSIASAADARSIWCTRPSRRSGPSSLGGGAGRIAHTLHEQGRLEAQRFLERPRSPAAASTCACRTGTRESRSSTRPKHSPPTSL